MKLNLIINHTSMEPIYEQIMAQIKAEVIEGTLTAGDALPSVRALSRELKISALTVKKAYDSLEAEGLVVTVHGKGSFIANTNQELLMEERRKELEKELEEAVRKARVGGLTAKEIRESFEIIMEDEYMLVQLDHVRKTYGSFTLELNMQIPENQIIGLIGANGAGKSTTFKLMLGLIRPDQGSVEIFGRNAADLGAEEKQEIGAVFSDSGFSEYLKVQQLIPVMSRFYPDFQEKEFRERCERFQIPLNKQIKEFSTGMKAKLNVFLALSHGSRLLLLDEPTAGLDVVAREEILDLLREYMEIPGRSIVISSHISGDLEHFCDDLYMIHEGKIVLHEETDRILEEYGFLKVSDQEYEALDKEYLLRVRKEPFGYSYLTDQKNYYLENHPGIVVEKGSVDEVISMLVKGERL